jgi:hypothetical protein
MREQTKRLRRFIDIVTVAAKIAKLQRPRLPYVESVGLVGINLCYRGARLAKRKRTDRM